MARSRAGKGRSSLPVGDAVEQRVGLLGASSPRAASAAPWACAPGAPTFDRHDAFAQHEAEQPAHGRQLAADGDGGRGCCS